MKPLFTLFFIVGIHLAAYSQPVAESPLQCIDSLGQSVIRSNGSVGVQLGIQLAKGKRFSKAYGYADLTRQNAVRNEDEFRIASLTKSITAVAIMTLVEKGKLKLTDKLATFFNAFPNASSITIYQLLSHTSGIPNWWEGELPADTPKDFPMCKQPHLYLQRMKRPSFFEPGTKHYYSNSGYVLLGEIIELVSHQRYEAYLKAAIFSPAKMDHTEVEYEPTEKSNWVTGYKKATPPDTGFVKADVYSMPFSAGALRSTAADLLNFLEAFYAGQLVKKSTVRLMTEYAQTITGIPVYAANYSPSPSSLPALPTHIKKYGYGLGFSLMELYSTPVVWHSGGISGFNALFFYMPTTKASIVLLSNTENGLTSILKELEKELVKLK